MGGWDKLRGGGGIASCGVVVFAGGCCALIEEETAAEVAPDLDVTGGRLFERVDGGLGLQRVGGGRGNFWHTHGEFRSSLADIAFVSSFGPHSELSKKSLDNRPPSAGLSSGLTSAGTSRRPSVSGEQDGGAPHRTEKTERRLTKNASVVCGYGVAFVRRLKEWECLVRGLDLAARSSPRADVRVP